MILYKRNAQGNPIYWNITEDENNKPVVKYGLVGKSEHTEVINQSRKNADVVQSLVKAKRKEGYKELSDLYDNAPVYIAESDNLWHYLNTYLPKFNTHEDGRFIPMLCKTLQDNTPFEKGNYIADYKINGERCIITASKSNDLFQEIKLHYRSREGVDWTDKLSYLDKILIPKLETSKVGGILDMMLEEGAALDGELYLPGYGINEINSFIKNVDLPQHYQLQYWCYDIAVENMKAVNRKQLLFSNYSNYIPIITSKADHLNNKSPFVIVPTIPVFNIVEATTTRDRFIDLGFEGLVIREENSEYQFGGKRNNAMLKYKKKEDGLFEVVGIKPDKRDLPIFTLKNDINDELFEATINLPQAQQKEYLAIKDKVIGKGKARVEYRERSGVKQVPFHAKIITISYD